jgi:hypothetical protein
VNRKQIILEAIAGNKEILSELNDFAENEGHPNAQVMLAVCEKITRLENEIAEMESELNVLEEKEDSAKHPSRLTVIESSAGERYLIDWFKFGVPEGFRKVTSVVPIPEKYWSLPIYQVVPKPI